MLFIYSCSIFTLVAVVGLEKTFYQVTEDVGVVEVCAIAYSPTIVCPIDFPFDVSLSTRNDGATKNEFMQLYSLFVWNYINIRTKKKLYSHL